MKLFYQKQGSGPPMIILHGLFGSSDNWNFQAKNFSKFYTVFLLDQRNHGQSPHHDMMNLDIMADDLNEFLSDQGIKKPILLGHSLGGKVAMNFAVRFPERVRKLIVVDIVPKYYPPHHKSILEGMKLLPLNIISSRREAEDALVKYIPEVSVRQFLLKNLVRVENKFKWRINLKAIDNNIELIGDGLSGKEKYFGPSLFILGTKSSYFKKGDNEVINNFFPKAELSFLAGGHWLHVECPEDFLQIILSFLTDIRT